MDANFWQQRWEKGDIGFHVNKANPILVEHLKRLNLKEGSRLFIPLCGKTLDISWLLSNGYKVVGVELSELAINQLFNDLGIKPEIYYIDRFKHYRAKNIDIFAGDVFDFTKELIEQVDAVYDRAGLVALPEDVREKYSAHLIKITGAASQLLICYEYDQRLMAGPPFSIPGEEINQIYNAYELRLIECKSVEGGLKGSNASEMVYLLQKNN